MTSPPSRSFLGMHGGETSFNLTLESCTTFPPYLHILQTPTIKAIQLIQSPPHLNHSSYQIPTMDFLKGAMGNKNEGGDNQQPVQQESTEQKSGGGGGGFFGGIGDKLNSAAGGGKESEKNEDYLDKGESYLTPA